MSAAPAPTPDRTSGRLIYAVGDVHGRYDLLKELMGLVARDLAGRSATGGKPMLIFLGDYLDRGPDSARVLEALLWLRADARFEVRLLKGNHEEVFAGFMAHPERNRWLQVGGRATLASYGVSPPERLDDPEGCRAAADALRAAMPPAHRALLDELELMVVVGDYAFVHAGIRPERPLAEQAERDLLWIREGFLDRTERFEKRVVHGHSWTDAVPDVRPNRIGIDTGAFRTGVLTAVRLDDGGMVILRTGSGDPPGAG